MSSLEFRLQVLINLQGLSHLVIHEELVWNGQGDQELGSVGLPSEVGQPGEQPVEDMVDCSFLSVDDVSLVVGVEIAGVAQHFQEPADALLGFVLGLLLDVD